MPSADLIGGDYLVRFEARTLDDIRALGGNDEEDDRKFATVARVSEINLGLYRTFVQPWVQSLGQRRRSPNGCASFIRCACSTRCSRTPIRSCGRCCRPSSTCAENRQPVAKDNAFWQAQERFAEWIETSLDAYRDVRDHMSEALFHAIYGSPLVQALVGLKASGCESAPQARQGCRTPALWSRGASTS